MISRPNRLLGRISLEAGLAILCMFCFEAGAAEVRVSSREQFVSALESAVPGTTVLLAPGKYRGGIAYSGLRGTKERPIVIASADARRPAVFEGGGSGIQLSSPAYVELRNLVFRGAEANGVNIDDGGRIDQPAHHVVLSNLVVENEGPRGNRDGMKLSGVNDFRITDCRIERWGMSGSAIDFVGCHQGTVERCTFRHRGADFANGVQMKGGSSDIVVQRCRFDHAGGRALNLGGSTGAAYFRPKGAGYEARNLTVEDCTIVGSMAAIAFVGVDGATVRYNTIYAPERWVLRILQENQSSDLVVCRNGRFTNNVVLFRADAVRSVVNIGGGTAPETFTFSGNVWHCADRPGETRRLVQLPAREQEATYGTDPGLRSPSTGDFALKDPKRFDAGVRPESNDR